MARGGFRRVQREGVSIYHGQCSHRSRKNATGIIIDTDVDGVHDSVEIPVDVDLVEGEDPVGRREGVGWGEVVVEFDGAV